MKSLYHQIVIGFCFVIPGSYSSLNAQNLVPNDGFDVQDSCPSVSEIEIAIPWNSPTLGSPDLFNNSCPSQQGSSRSGIGSSGIYTYSTFADNREYLQVRLTSPLTAGVTYDVTFYCQRNDFFSLAVDRIGAFLSTTEYSLTSTSPITSVTPQIENPAGMVLSSTGYNLITGSMVAAGGEEYLIIGNFRDDAGTVTQDIENNGNLKSYYYIDDVSVFQFGTSVREVSKDVTVRLYPNPSTGPVNIEVFNHEQGSDLSFDIIDINGRIVSRDSYGSDVRRKLDLSSLDNGMYLIRIYSGNEYIAHKKVILR